MPTMAFTLPPLPFDRTALAPHMSAETLDYHHGKHHKAYVDKTNQLADEAGIAAKSLVEVIRAAKAGPLLSNAGQLWNHSFFWQCLAPNAKAPSGRFIKLIDADFGSTDALLAALADAAVAHFGSGWVWLLLDGDKLKIKALHDGDTPVAHDGMVPLLTLDLWEHAYYIDYRNARPDYAKAVLGKLINWDFAAQNLDGKGVSRADQG
jgi:Fe-Mn family superoxide dismutase